MKIVEREKKRVEEGKMDDERERERDGNCLSRETSHYSIVFQEEKEDKKEKDDNKGEN